MRTGTVKREITPLVDKGQTVRKMYSLAEDYARDLDSFMFAGKPISKMSMMEFYEYVRAIPFKRDNEPVEWVARPELLLRIAKGGLDCKKKGILMGAFFVRHGIPKSRWRFAVVSRRPDKFPHHVLPQVNLLGHWYNFDATYKGDRPFDNRIVTYMEPMKRPGGN